MSVRVFSGSSADKESACNAGDPSSTPGSGRSLGEGTGYPLQYSWASFMAMTVKNPPAMQETWVQSLDWDDPLEKGMATHSSVLCWRIPEPGGLQSIGLQESDRTERPTTAQHSDCQMLWTLTKCGDLVGISI